jgi:hypothetical protein
LRNLPNGAICLFAAKVGNFRSARRIELQGNLLSAPQVLQHFLAAVRAAAPEIIILDPLYSTHDEDENDTRAMAALCQNLLRLRGASHAALIVVHHVRKSIGRYEIGSAFRGSSALHAVRDSYVLLTRPSPQCSTLELRLQFRCAAPQPPRLLHWKSRPIVRNLYPRLQAVRSSSLTLLTTAKS